MDDLLGCESSLEVNLLEVNGESVSIPAPDLFDDRSSSSSVKGILAETDQAEAEAEAEVEGTGEELREVQQQQEEEEGEGEKEEEEGEGPSKHAKAVATSLTSSSLPEDQSPVAAAAAAADQQQLASTCSDQSCSSVMANEVIYSPCSLRNFSESEAFLPVFSRLPPDGHEFPSNYMENDDSLFRFCSVDNKSNEEFSPLASQLEKNLLEPPAGFEDTSLAKLSNMKGGDNRFVTGDYSAILNISESLGYEDDEDDDDDDDDDDELPPPPPMSPPQHQQLLYEIVNEPIEFEEYDDDDEEEEEELMLRNNSLSDIDKCSPPPIPPKRLSSTTSSSSSSTEKTVIAATTVNSSSSSTAAGVSPTKSTSSKETKTGNESMSVRDKIALFTAKVEQESFPPSKPVKTLLRSVSEPTKVKADQVVSSVDDDDDDNEEVEEDDDDDEDEEEEEDPVTAIEASTNINKCPADNLGFNYPSIDSSELNLYQDRPSSSLSVSSNFSKSSDDILGQDVDSSDMDDHHHQQHHHQLPQGSSLSLDRRSFYPPKYYEANRYSLDFSSNQLDSSLLKAGVSGGGNKTSGGAVDGGTKAQSMYAILESRKNTVSKLKGLVIPQIKKSSQQTVTAPVVPDLPLIYSVDSIIKPLTSSRTATETKSDGEESKADLKSPTKANYRSENVTANDSPKWLEALPPPPLPKSLPPLMETSVSLPVHSQPQLDHDLDDRLDTEDQESGISSIDSPNVSIHNTPPASPKEKPHRRHHHHHHPHHNKHLHSDQSQVEEEEDAMADDDVTLTTATSLTVRKKTSNSSDNSHLNWDSTDDSEASSSSDMRVLKANSVEAINRKNVLQSSRNSCGGNNDEVDAKIKLYSDAPKQPTSTVEKLNQRRSSDESPVVSPGFASTESSDGSSVCCGDVDSQVKRGADQSKRNAPVSDERWMELEKKYGNKPQESNGIKKLDKVASGRGATLPLQGKRREDNGSHIGFKALAETWKQRTSTVETEASSKSSQKLSKVIPNGSPANVASSRQVIEETIVAENGNKSLAVEATKTVVSSDKRSSSLGHDLRPMTQPPPPPPPPLSTSNNNNNNQVVHRERPNRASTGSVSRPTSLIETDSINLKLWPGVSFVEHERKSQVVSRSAALVLDSRAKRRGPVDGHHTISTYNKSNRSTSVNDLRQMFESPTSASVPHKKLVNRLAEPNNRRMVRENSSHIRMSSLDSTASESEPGTPGHYGSATSLGSSPAIDHYGSITSLASSTSLISPQELQQLIDEANQSLEESGTPSHEITVVVLQREIAGGSIGITLAGGADYDSKEITVNKVIAGSLADRDGRILKGDRVLSINGKNLKGLTHREALCILKAPRSDCVLVLSRNKSSAPPDVVKDVVGNGLISRSPNKTLPPRNSLNSRLNPPSAVICTKPEIAFCPADNLSVPASNSTSTVITTQIIKDSSGLGFSLDGGKDSPLGDRPITIKKIFNGTAADKNKDLHVGDEILSINGIDVTNMNRIAAWSIMKKLANGTVSLVVNQKR